MRDDLFDADDWFTPPTAPAQPPPGPPSPVAVVEPGVDAGPLIDLRRGMTPQDIARAGSALEDRLAGELDAGYAAMLAQVRAGLLADRRPTASDAQPIITRLADARDLCVRVSRAWANAGRHAEALAGDLLHEEIGDDRAVVADGHGAELVATYRPKVEHSVDDATVLGVIRARANLAAEAFGTPDADEAYLRGASAVLELLPRLARLEWRRTELDVLARELQEAGHVELAATLQRAVSSREVDGTPKIERREASKGRKRGDRHGAAQTG